jgi:proline iminopeptidase
MFGGKRIYTEIYGDRESPTFLYLHGGPGVGSYDFNLVQAHRLSKFIRLISIDQRGCLRSDAIEEVESFGLQNLMEDFELIRKLLSIEKWGLIGHSFGGYLAIEYAIRHPEVIDTLVLECPTFDFTESLRSVVKKAEKLYREDGCDEIAERCKMAYSHSLKELDRVFFDISDKRDQVYIRGLDPKFFNEIVNQSGIPQNDWLKQTAFQQKINHEVFSQPNLDKLSSISCHTLLIKGKYDPICSEYQTEEFIRNVRNSTVEIFNNSAHMPRHEEPELFAETIKNFVDKNISSLS